MTSTVIIKAHCSSTKEVVVKIESANTGESFTLQDGESRESYVCDDRVITVREVEKSTETKSA